MDLQAIQLFNNRQKATYALRTGIFVDIQQIGKLTTNIAVKQKDSLREIRQGVWLKIEGREITDGNFTNVYDFFWNQMQDNLVPILNSSSHAYFLQDRIKNDPSTVVAVNGAFYFLADVADSMPHDLPYNLSIRDKKVYGLPSADVPAAYIKNGKLLITESKATGIIKIGKQKIRWVGANSMLKKRFKNRAVLYNSKCATIIKMRDERGVQIGIVDNETITTPRSKNSFDMVINQDTSGHLFVSGIHQKGRTHFYSGLFILRMKGKSSKFRVGMKVKPLTLDKLTLQGITSAFSIGKNVHDKHFKRATVRDIRDARTFLARDVAGNMHVIVADGSKYIPGFKGMANKDIISYFSPDKFTDAYYLDGGGSSRLIVRDNRTLKHFGNEFAFRKMPDGSFLWDWKKARLLASSLTLRVLDS